MIESKTSCGLPSLCDSSQFWAGPAGTEHIREVHIDGQAHNNKMERMNGELRDRERVMRTLEKPDTPILSGMQILHNYVRPLEALDGKTPAEVAGIKVEGDNIWLTIIQNAKREKWQR